MAGAAAGEAMPEVLGASRRGALAAAAPACDCTSALWRRLLPAAGSAAMQPLKAAVAAPWPWARCVMRRIPMARSAGEEGAPSSGAPHARSSGSRRRITAPDSSPSFAAPLASRASAMRRPSMTDLMAAPAIATSSSLSCGAPLSADWKPQSSSHALPPDACAGSGALGCRLVRTSATMGPARWRKQEAAQLEVAVPASQSAPAC
mmetsp:Transcript_18955/g.49583  ORF Transcript_18955/g.49583 Transcript_18955/m.49583 type:complete len:205 (+) Transcript_18955:145-759(+)